MVSNIGASICITPFLFLGGEVPSWSLLWQPAVIALLYMGGQTSILSAVTFGDVSVATPVASSKVLFVTFLLAILTSTVASWQTWLAAVLATIGVVMINFAAPKSDRKTVIWTLALAIGAAITFSLFDISVQVWSTQGWGAGRLVPISFWFVGIFSVVYLPYSNSISQVRKSAGVKSLLIGGMFVGLQAACIVFALSRYGDAARLNIVYSLRGLWGVLFAWMFASYFGGSESKISRGYMVARLVGASLLVVAVVITILAGAESNS